MLSTRTRAETPKIDGRTLVFEEADRIPGGRLAVRLDTGDETTILIRVGITDAESTELDAQLHELLGEAGAQKCWSCLIGQPQHQCTS
ncbi:hypothetical protein BX265_6126 [Streptomyces sp. TLI_235]|nr:hypothetical protein [Streptomyces sp. TLI_235]PBC71516.1 hypothetical protein BX265_6126 [Streptomyces sp. TLI_235]